VVGIRTSVIAAPPSFRCRDHSGEGKVRTATPAGE
jgi:hypothetical protein